MNRIFAAFAISLLLMTPSRLLAKAETSKITIEGADLKTPIEITDPKVLSDFFVWAGAGTSSNQGKAFIIDWGKGAVGEPPKGCQRYQVSFYAKLPDERRIYVVFYEYDPATARGYVYLPAKTDMWYALNVSTILRGVEGKWFRAWSTWDKVAGPLVASPKVATRR